MAVSHYLEHEARKASFTGDFSGEELRREAAAYAQQLASLMVEENVSKVVMPERSKLFGQATVWDAFTGDAPLLVAAQKAGGKAYQPREGEPRHVLR